MHLIIYLCSLLCLFCVTFGGATSYQSIEDNGGDFLCHQTLTIPEFPSTGLYSELLWDTSAISLEEDEEMQADLHRWEEVNPAVCGSISIDEMGIYYPIVQSIEDNNEWLRRDLFGDESKAGCIFMDYRCDIRDSSLKIIHGHNMADGSMFSKVPNYLKLESLDQSVAPLITLYTREGKRVYEVFSVLSVNSTDEAFPVDDLLTKGETEEMLIELLNRSIVKGGLIHSLDSVMLNTCWYGANGGEHNLHCLVVASRVN